MEFYPKVFPLKCDSKISSVHFTIIWLQTQEIDVCQRILEANVEILSARMNIPFLEKIWFIWSWIGKKEIMLFIMLAIIFDIHDVYIFGN